MGTVKVERSGGFAGFGGPSSRLVSDGTAALDELSSADKSAVEELFARKGGAAAQPDHPDAFTYTLTRCIDGRSESVSAPESAVPEVLRAVVQDRLRD